MLITGYRKEFVRPPNPGAEHLRCTARLDTDISDLLPYLNTVLGGHQYFTNPASLTLKLPGKLVTLHAKHIAINILKDEAEADAILQWLVEKANETWSRREEIQPSFGHSPKPRVLEILKMLPKENCTRCGHPTCMVFAVRLSEGAGRLEECPLLDDARKQQIGKYLDELSHPGH